MTLPRKDYEYEEDKIVCYSREGVRFYTLNDEYTEKLYSPCGFAKDFSVEAVNIWDYSIPFLLDFENSLVKKDNIYLTYGKLLRRGYSQGTEFGIR